MGARAESRDGSHAFSYVRGASLFCTTYTVLYRLEMLEIPLVYFFYAREPAEAKTEPYSVSPAS